MDALLTTIVLWLSVNYNLPAVYEHPRVEFAPPQEIVAKRYAGLLARADIQADIASNGPSPLIAIYDFERRVVYLPQGWTGTSPAESSVLVHEMVHHLQNVGAMHFNCPEEREHMAYDAQEKWLGLMGRSLETDFQLDRFTLLVKTRCLG